MDSFEQPTTQIGRLRINRYGSTLASTIFAAYAPTSSYQKEEVDAFFMGSEKRGVFFFLTIFAVTCELSVGYFISWSRRFVKVADAIAKPSTYTTCINSAINIFVYLVLYKEFRDEFMRIVLRINKDNGTEEYK
ncbi:hypothetical protein NECAME_09488 [Necator americanus]|uniref:7TM GPCR serpentine receptor class x (Srx) domain-containing protein n=1 Tax=Necator americanus TaxID=51031 RepID=W2TFH7_NECAM|nr:hypothetical protein NECAME_09488 [Necator americanus]ETN79951.1 hypothetical protein NECAME_09488 [Necator americanus]